MLDHQKWKIAVARFTGYCANLPPFPKTEDVDDYHAIVAALEQASGQDLSNFKIPAEKLKPKIISVRPAPYRGGRGGATYSQDNYCDSNFFQSQIAALKHFLPSMEADGPKTQYDDLHDWQLEELMVQRGIKPQRVIENGRQVYKADRNYIIAALVKQDSPAPPQHSTTINMYDSNLNYASPGASITSNVGGFTKEEFRNLIDGLRQLLRDEKLDEAAKNEINVNIGTIELQLNSAQPNAPILKESLKSVKTILQNAATSLITSGVLATVNQVLAKL